MANILIVDDSKTSRRMIRRVLEAAGHVIVAEASNGEEGVIAYQKERPDLVTMDVTMPVMDGIEALQVMLHEDPQAKVIMITALGQSERMVQAIKQGAIGFIAKPFQETEIINAVENALSK
ncbi:MAG: response regulator [Lachnospiraceae bacterium]|nr:response regulator [Lachnospiraceae bacterium]